MEPFFFLLVGAFIFCGGAAIFVRSLKHLRRTKESAHWPRFPAVITHAEVETRSDSDGYRYIPRIRFSYEVNGRAYSGNRIAVVEINHGGIGAKRRADSIIRKYPVSGRVSVAVDPDNHTYSVLEPNKRFPAYVVAVWSALVLTSGLYIIGVLIRVLVDP